MELTTFTEEQAHYLQGFAAGSGLAKKLAQLPTFGATLGLPSGSGHPDRPERPEAIHMEAQERVLGEGKELTNEEKAKRDLNGLDIWDKIVAHSRDKKFPKGTDVFLFKFMGLFYVSPAQDAFMCRLRLPAGALTSHQMRGIAELAGRLGGGYCDVTTRANLQIREVTPPDTVDLLMGLADLGIINRGAGADNVRNITASPTAGIDARELIDVSPLARRMNHHILNHRELYGLPRKFNIAFDGGGAISVLGDTNDLCFAAVTVVNSGTAPPGVYFRMLLGGITGHHDFATDAGVILTPDECIEVASAALAVFIEKGDRTDRKKARLKYVLDQIGHDGFLLEMEKRLGRKLVKLSLSECRRPAPPIKHAHVGVHAQKQDGRRYLGVVLPAGRMDEPQMRALASIANRFGSGELRLTVWQNIIIPNVAAADVVAVEEELHKANLSSNASNVRAGLVACTGSAGCKYAAADTKKHALAIATELDGRITLDQPVNIHLTGCPHSCAQHHIGDIGLLATKIASGEDTIEGYHLFVGGGYGDDAAIGRQVLADIPAPEVPEAIEQVLRSYLECRRSPEEGFSEFVRRHSLDELKALFEPVTAEIGASL
ncbi:MAG: NirA family protein [Tepidisphaerales bacterium]